MASGEKALELLEGVSLRLGFGLVGCGHEEGPAGAKNAQAGDALGIIIGTFQLFQGENERIQSEPCS